MADVLGNASYPKQGSAGQRTMVSPHPPSAGRRSSPGSGHGRRRGTPKTPEERFSPAPEYMRPMCQSAHRRWKKQQEQVMMEELVDKWTLHTDANHRSRDEARRLARKIPMEILAKEWLNMEGATIETRAFLVDKVLPTLILGVEKLLIEVDKKDLSLKEESDNNFNPVNFLAQYLMRNNPRYSNFSEASPYIRGLREVTDTLKEQLFEYEDNRLARIKAEAKRKREEREKIEQLKQGERQRREEALKKQFMEWNVGADGRIELAVLQNALRSFIEIAEMYPKELREGAELSQPVEATDMSGKSLGQWEFSSYINQFILDMPSVIFDHFLSHLSKCARSYRMSAGKEIRRGVLTDLFSTCDHSGIGLLDRHRILNLFEMFWDKLSAEVKESMRNPRQWPVVEVDEASFSDSEDEGETAAADKKDETDQAKEAEGEAVDSTTAKDEKEVEESKEAEQEQNIDTEDAKEKESDESKQKSTDANAEQDQEKPGVEAPADAPADAGAESMSSSEQIPELNGQKASDAEEDKEKSSEKKGKEAEVGDDVTEKQDAEKEPAEQVEAQVTEDGKEEASESAEKESEEGKSKEELEEKEDEEKATGETLETIVEKEEPVPEKEAVSKEAQETAQDAADATVPSSEQEGKTTEDEVTDKEKASSELPEKESDETVQQEADETEKVEPKSDEIMDLPPLTAENPPMTQQSKVSFADGTTFEREKTNMTTTSQRSQSQASAFDESSLNVSQFVQVTESFLGDDPTVESFSLLVDFIRDGYVETEEEKMQRLMKAKQEEKTVKRRQLLNNLFEMWDNDGSGFIDLDEVETVMKKYKDGQEEEAIDTAKKSLKKKNKHHDMRLSKREFRDFVYKVAEHMAGEEAFDMFVDFLVSSVEKSYTERMRGEARKKWLKQIITAAETGGASMEPVYKTVFQSLYKDAETHGGGKKVSAYITLLERNAVAPSRGDTLLRYMASTTDDAPYLLGKCLYQDMKGISFASVESGKPIHVPRVTNHGNIFFWNHDRPQDERDGSFIVVPLKDKEKRVFGLLGIDTLYDPQPRTIFITHEIQFFQGIAKAFSIAYHHVDMKKKTMRLAESAVSWIHRRCLNISEITVYMVEPEGKTSDFVLRKMMATDERGNAVTIATPPRLERKDNLFRDYLFRCVDNSESVTADAYGQRHLSFPLRDLEGRAIVVVDISIGNLKSLPKAEQKEVMRMLKLMQVAYRKITQETVDDEQPEGKAETEKDEENSIDTLFDRLMLMELRENVAKLDARAYAELKSYKEPPKIIHLVLKAVLSVIYPEHAESGALENWVQCKNLLHTELSNKIVALDPTSKVDDRVPVDKINEYLNEVPHGAVDKHGSIPTKHLYSWVFVAVSLIEHTRKMEEEKRRQNVGTEGEAEKEEAENVDGTTEETQEQTAGEPEISKQQTEGEGEQQMEQPVAQSSQE